MESSGIIKKYTVVLDNGLMGDVIAFVMISVMYHLPKGDVINQEELAKKVKANENVEEVQKYLRNIAGIERTQTLVVLKSVA